MKKEVRVRFAPSPTGALHIGGVRTALFNYLIAKKQHGTFILRIEDTDQTRYVEGAEDYINESLEWLGLVPAEGVRQGGQYGPYRQSERKEIYRKYVDQLLDSNWAYYAFDTPEELDILRKKFESEGKTFQYDHSTRESLKNSLTLPENEWKKLIAEARPYVIRFNMPKDETISVNDLIRGPLSFNSSGLDDKVLFKSDGLPTYHLANIVDDYLMKISHVIRGEEWLPSLPLHVMLYKAFGWKMDMPEFAHLPLILKPSGKGKLSKRDGDKDGFPVIPLEWKTPAGELVRGFRESGYLPAALLNFLALLGWNPGTEQEIFSINELIEAFSLNRVNKSGARFDPEKAKWFNQHYLQSMTNHNLAEAYNSILKRKGINIELKTAEKIVGMVKERAVFVNDLWEQSSYFFIPPVNYDENAVKKFWKDDSSKIVEDCIGILLDVKNFISPEMEEQIKMYVEKHQLGFGKVMNPLRIAIVGAAKGPHLFDIMEIIGKEETIKRIERAMKEI
jgi:glutamyl-tRNA synthetase